MLRKALAAALVVVVLTTALSWALRRVKNELDHDNAIAYVRRVMVNTHISRWRTWQARVRLVAPPDTSVDDPGLRRSDEWDLLRRALVKLPVRQRTVLVLRYYEDLPDASIAELMGCAPGTVRSQAARGLAALRPLLDPGLAGTIQSGATHDP